MESGGDLILDSRAFISCRRLEKRRESATLEEPFLHSWHRAKKHFSPYTLTNKSVSNAQLACPVECIGRGSSVLYRDGQGGVGWGNRRRKGGGLDVFMEWKIAKQKWGGVRRGRRERRFQPHSPSLL